MFIIDIHSFFACHNYQQEANHEIFIAMFFISYFVYLLLQP